MDRVEGPTAMDPMDGGVMSLPGVRAATPCPTPKAAAPARRLPS